MEKATRRLVATKEESGDVDLVESETCSFHEEEVTGRLVAYKIVTGGNLEHPANQKPRKIPELKEKDGHTIYTFLQIPCLSWKQSSRSSETSTNESPRTQWRTWT